MARFSIPILPGLGRMPKAGWAIENSDVRAKWANPNRETVDAFDCGTDEWYEREVNATVHKRKWAENDNILRFEFFLKNRSVGFAFLINKRYSIPTAQWDKPPLAIYRLIMTIGVNRGFRKSSDPNPNTGESAARVMMRFVEGLNRDVIDGSRKVGTVEYMYLTVYTDNAHAKGFYEHLDYEEDKRRGEFKAGPEQAPAVAMLKQLPPL